MNLMVLFWENASDILTHRMYLCNPNRKNTEKLEVDSASIYYEEVSSGIAE